MRIRKRLAYTLFPFVSLPPQKKGVMDQRLQNILEGAVALFKNYGLRSISMDEVARSMGMSKKTLYQYVDNKDDLIRKALEYIIEKTSSKDVEDRENYNAIDVLMEISRLVRLETVEINPNVIFDLHKYYPVIYRSIFVKKRDMIYDDVVRNFNRGIAEGLYREDIDIDLVARLYVKNLMEIHDPEFINVPFSKIFHVMFDTHIRSIVNEKGLEYYKQQLKT